MAQQGALHARSPAEDHPPSNTTRAHRAWSPSVQAGEPLKTIQGQLRVADRPLARRAGKGSERQLPRGLSAPRDNWAARNYRGGLLCAAAQRLGLNGIEDFLPVNLVTSPFRSATTAGNRLTQSTFDLKGASSPGHTGARRGVQPASG